MRQTKGLGGISRAEVASAERHLVRIAADILAEDDDAIGVTYSGFCQASPPHKKLPAEKECIPSSERLNNSLLYSLSHIVSKRTAMYFKPAPNKSLRIRPRRDFGA